MISRLRQRPRDGSRSQELPVTKTVRGGLENNQEVEDVMPGNKKATASRRKGAQNKVSAVRPGESKLDYMLRIMRDPRQDASVRMAMAKAALPYCHTRPLPVRIPFRTER